MKALNGTRFGMFAAAHILWSMVCSLFVPKLLGSELISACTAAVAMMLVYLGLGWLTAHLCHWPLPTHDQSLWAVFLPAGIAWLWAGTTAFCLYVPGDYIGLAAALGLPAFLLASPSLLFVMAFMGWVGASFYQSGIITNEVQVVGIAIFFAGLLPSLLFWLGSCLGGRKKGYETKGPETA